MSNYQRGSEWRRWELHMHTPFTKKNDNFEGASPQEKWDLFYKSIHDYVGDGTDPLKSICVLAITDYLSIDNYVKVKSDNLLPDCVKLILPNVELRMKPISKGSPVNIHCIFSPQVSDQIESRFFSKLKFEYKQGVYNATETELIRFGRDYSTDSNLSDTEAYKAGLEQYILSYENLSAIFKDDPELRSNTIIVVSNKSKDGASGVAAHSSYFEGAVSQLNATQQAIYQLSDMIYSSNPKDVNYFLGKGIDNDETVKHKCGSLMPCIHGCDAHSNGSIFEPDQKRYCWIKADPTFEGFKQVIYEPKERVRISSSYPDPKQSYHVIDRVEISGNNDFNPEPIYFSENLTCIIGGKSTGKSLLLHNVAYAIDETRVKEKATTAATNVKQLSGLKVFWKDGWCSDQNEAPHKIVYIPQTYLNRLSDDHEETTEIDSIIQDIVLQDEIAHELFENMNVSISEHQRLVAKTTVDLLQTVSECQAISDAQKEIGNKSSIEMEIINLSEQMEQLSKEYNVTEDEVKDYQTAAENVQQLSGKVKILQKEKETFESIDSVLQKRELHRESISMFTSHLLSAVEKTQDTADVYWLNERKLIVQQIDDTLLKIYSQLSAYQSQVEKLKPKMDGNEQISKFSASILKERERLDKLTKYDTDLKRTQEKYDLHISILAKAFIEFNQCYTLYVNNINDNFSAFSEDLEFKAQRVFRSEQFSQKILDIFDQRSLKRFGKFDLREVKELNVLDENNMRELIESILSKQLETLQLKTGRTQDSALRDIFTNWNNVDYIVKMDEDSIEEMSPGKKALVLLRLLISLAESKCPILIDQPEDDLDNRSIFDELITFIKSKKVDRQIIVATHNANIVLCGDAELVLIANQRGKNAPNNTYRFEYRGGAIENNSPITDETGKIKDGILNSKGIQTHICEILEGGERAFELRKQKYHI